MRRNNKTRMKSRSKNRTKSRLKERSRQKLSGESMPPISFDSMESRQLMSATLMDGVMPGIATPDSLAAIVDSLNLDEVRAVDGSGNNVDNADWGRTDTNLLRLTTVEYADGISAPAGQDLESARLVSNEIAANEGDTPNERYLTDIAWLFGQFIDHDIDLTENASDPAEPLFIDVPTGDPFFDPDSSGDDSIFFFRSNYDESTGDSEENPREQVNQITAFLDGSVIYGSDQERADALRTFEEGMLILDEDGLLPFNTEGFANASAGQPAESLFLAGDVRANENAALTAMHTLWVREHNYWASVIGNADDTLDDEAIYQAAKTMVTAELQAITYNEFLPALLGQGAVSDYEGYDADVNAGIANSFSTAFYRFGHSMLSTELSRLDTDGNVIEDGNLSLSDAFFAPGEISDNGIDSLLFGATSQVAQEIDNQIIDDVRNFLFGEPGSGGFDLASLNIQRGRDHGLADYNQIRDDMGLGPVTSFADITSNVELQAALESVYGSVDNIDAWVGGLAEDHVTGSSVGELIQSSLVDQFERIRDGDRFWYENILDGKALVMVDQTTLADVIMRNTDIEGLQDNVFFSEDVLTYDANERGSDNRKVVSVDGDTVTVTSDATRRVLASLAAADVEKLVLNGSSQSDRFVIHGSTFGLSLPGGIEISGDGGRDVLVIRGTSGSDDIHVSNNLITVNGQEIVYDDFERVVIKADMNLDNVVIDDDVDARVNVESHHHHHHGHQHGQHSQHSSMQAPSAFDSMRGVMAFELETATHGENGGRGEQGDSLVNVGNDDAFIHERADQSRQGR